MGYRSQVAFSISGTKQNVLELKKYIEGLCKEGEESNFMYEQEATFLYEHLKIIHEDGMSFIRFFEQEIKWYVELESIWASISTLSESIGCSYAFRRLGEDTGDIEDYGYGFGDIESNDVDYIFELNPSWAKSLLYVTPYTVYDFIPKGIALTFEQREKVITIARDAVQVAITDYVLGLET